MHYYQFNIGDYAKSTKYLTDLQDLAYRRLLDICYDSEKPLPKTVEEVAEIIGFLKNPSEVDQVLKKYFKLTKNGFIQKRVQKELGVYQSKALTARVNGKKGGRPKNNPEITQSVNLANPEITQSKAKQEPITNNHKPITNLKNMVLPDWINQELWDGFMEVRKGLRAKNTDVAIKALINKLTKFRSSGFDPNEAISNSIESSWKGVFEPKHQNGTKKFNLTEALKNDMQRITEREMGDGPVCEVTGYLHGQVG